MASKQTRRSISVRGTTYAQLRDFCVEHDRSMSDVVEELLGRILEGTAAHDAGASPKKTVAPLVARAPQKPAEIKAPEPKPVARVAPQPERIDREDRAAFRVEPPARPAPKPEPAPTPAPRAAIPARPAPARPTPVANAGRPAPTPAAKVEGTTRGKPGSGDYRAIRF